MVIRAEQGVTAGDVELNGMSGHIKLRAIGANATVKINRQTIVLYEEDGWLELDTSLSNFTVVSGTIDYIAL